MIGNRILETQSDAQSVDETTDIASAYLKLLHLVERLHRQLLDVVKDELDRHDQRDINAVQALLVYNIGDSEFTAGELRTRGHYLGSNVSYNLKKLVETGYISHQRNEQDRRSVRIALTQRGHQVHSLLSSMFERHLGSVEQVGGVSAALMGTTNVTLERLERFWGDQIRYRL